MAPWGEGDRDRDTHVSAIGPVGARWDRELIPYRLRTVRIGVVASIIAIVLLALYPPVAPSGSIPSLGWYYGLIAAAAVGVLVVTLLPWEQLFLRGWGMPAMYLWSVGDILIISAEVAVTGGVESEVWAVYLLTTVFFAASYPLGGQVALLAFTALAYVAAVLVAGDPVTVAVVVRLASLSLLALMGSFLSRELMRQMDEHLRHRGAAEQHAEILDRVAAASRQLQSHDTEAVLEAVVETVADLGLSWAGIARLDPGSRTFRIEHSRGLPPRILDEAHVFRPDGPLARLIETGGLVATDVASDELIDASWEPARGVVLAPIHVRGDIVSVLGGIVLEGEGPVEGQVAEAIELLASLAGRALELAAAFEDERGAVERLEQLDRLKRDFLSNVSHELRTPLTVMLGVTELLHDRWEQLDDDRKRDLVRRQTTHVATLERTIGALLEFSKIEGGLVEPTADSFDLVALTSAVCSRMRPALEHHTLVTDWPERADAFADEALVERVVENLLTNAAIHTPPGTTVTVAIAADGDGDGVRLTVADDGPGIPAEEVEHLTDRFFRGGDPDTRPTRGLGLGLALSREILFAHRSKLELETEHGRGTRFSFVLPARSSARSPSRSYPATS